MNKVLVSNVISIIVMLCGIMVMWGWIADITVLKSILPGWVTMKFITALSFFFSGLLVLLINQKNKGEICNFLILAISFGLLLLMVTFLVSLFSGISTGIESLFVQEKAQAVRTTIPGVPAIPTIICFIFIALTGFLYLNYDGRSWSIFILGIWIGFLGLLAFFGYLLNIPLMYYSFPGYTSMAFSTSILFALLGISISMIKFEEEIK